MRKILLIALLATSACKKKDADDNNKAMDKMADKAKPEADPAAAPATPPPKAGDNPIKSSDDFVAVNKKMNGILVEAMHQPDCDKAAAAVETFLGEHTPDILALKKWETDHPDDKAKVADDDNAQASQVGPVVEKCKDNKAFMDAIKKMPE